MSKVLLIDDDPDFLDATSLILEADGYEVDTADTPEKGVAAVTRDRPDLVILDVMMPDAYEGFRVAREIRETLKLTELPIIMLSGLHKRNEVNYHFAPEADYLPVDEFLDKPVSPTTLLTTVRRLLGTSG